MNWNPITRRHFLRGPGRAALMLPILPSLMSSKAEAQAAANKQKSFIGIQMLHGWQDQYSLREGGTSSYMPVFKNMTTFAGVHPIHYKPLANTLADNGGQISKTFDAQFNPYVAKTLMLQGFDWNSLLEKHHWSHFGNAGISFNDLGVPPMASIDQVMAYSTNFYKNPALIGRSLLYTAAPSERGFYNPSVTYANPSNKLTSAIVDKNAETDPGVVWDKFFKTFTKPATQPVGPTFEQTVVDLVLADYKAVAASPRLGKGDKQRIDRHIELLHATETSVKALPVMGTCTPPGRPGAVDSSTQAGREAILRAMNSLVVSLISCGLCHSFIGKAACLLSNDSEMWHHWSHGENTDPLTNETNQIYGVAHVVILDLIKKLDQNGLLDDSLVFVPQEHNNRKHASWNLPVAMFGSAGGALKTGQYLDYRVMNAADPKDGTGYTQWGYPMNQLFANILMAMDVPPSEFEPLNRDLRQQIFSPNSSGYGSNFIDPNVNFGSGLAAYRTMFKGKNLSEWLPLIKA